jgi:tetratricopeptide (TPR) repeat protein
VPGYEVLEEIGRGGMGVVYKARQVALDRIVALKVILAGGHAGEEERARFRTEAEAIARLAHPGIVAVHEVGEHGGLPYFSLEFCAAGSLEKKLAGTPLPPGEAAALLRKLAEAMQAAHEAKVVHRDLKPANVLLSCVGQAASLSSSEGQAGSLSYDPKITDFGLAKRLDVVGQTVSGAVMGTPSYMAPEQAQGSKDVGPGADIYALGAILYECLTGRPPFRAATPLDTLTQVLTDEPVSPRGLNPAVPRDLETICLKCLRKAPAQRYGSARELADDLGRFLQGEPVRARPTPAWERAGKWCRRRPAAAALVAVSALALAALAGVGAWSNKHLQRERDDADRERRAAETARDEAEQRRQWAERNFKKANEAVDAMLAEVGETWLKYTPQAAPVRKVLLEKALAFYKEFLDDRQDDPAIRRQLAQAHLRVANIHALLGEDARALDSLKQALAVSRELVQAGPRDVKSREAVAIALSDLGTLHKRLGNKDRSEKAYLESLEVLAELARDFPGETDSLLNTAGCLSNLATLTDDPAVSLPRFEKAVATYRQVLATEPTRASARKGLAGALNNQSQLLVRVGKRDRAESALRDGIALLEKMAPAARAEASAVALATLRVNLGDLYLERGRWNEAERQYTEALPFFERQAREQVRVPDYRLQLGIAHAQLAIVYRETRRPGQAARHDDLTLELFEGLLREYPHVPEYRDRLASWLNTRGVRQSGAGRTAEAEKTLLRALELFRGVPEQEKRTEGEATVHNNLAKVYLRGGKLAQAEKEMNQALKLRQELARAHPEVPRYRANVAASYINLGGLYDAQGRRAAADRAYRQAIRRWKALVKDQPGVPEYLRHLGKAHYNLGHLRGKGGGEAALESYDEALKIFEPLVKAHPRVAQFTHDLAQARANRALLFYQAGKLDQAEQDFLAVLPLFQALHDDHPGEHEYLKDLSIAHHTLGIVCLATKRPARARKALERALELRRQLVKEHGDVPEYHDLLAGSLATLAQYHWQRGERGEAARRYAEAREMFEALVKEHPDQPAFSVRLARIAFNQGLFAVAGGQRQEALTAFTRGAEAAEAVISKGIRGEEVNELWLVCRRGWAGTARRGSRRGGITFIDPFAVSVRTPPLPGVLTPAPPTRRVARSSPRRSRPCGSPWPAPALCA